MASKKGIQMNKPEVKQGSVDVTIKGKSPAKTVARDYPDAESLASKYGLADGKDGTTSLSDQGLSLEQQMEFMQKQQQLVQRLESKNQEIGKLCTLLEAVEPMPGMDPEKYQRILENPDADMVDFRDAKIVELAKKSRKLQMLLTKERSAGDEKHGKIIELQQTIEKMRRELEDTMPSANGSSASDRVIRFQAQTHGSIVGASQSQNMTEEEDIVAREVAAATGHVTRETALANKKIEDLRRKLENVEEQNKLLSRALIKEVGNGASLEEAVDEGRKGRMQQIILLRNKVKKLEGMIEGGASTIIGGGGATIASSLSGLTGARAGAGGTMVGITRRTDVDSQAAEEIEYMSSVRKIAVDELSEAHQKLSNEYTTLASKHQGAKARVRTLEADAAQHRQQIKMVIAKTETDDKLIGALKAEITRLKEIEQKASVDRRSDNVEMRVQKASKAAAAVATKQQESELNRLRRLTKQQAEQLATQDGLIRELRSSGKNF